MSGAIPLREAALASIADRLATQLPNVAVERARRNPVDTDAETLPRLVVRGDDIEATLLQFMLGGRDKTRGRRGARKPDQRCRRVHPCLAPPRLALMP